MRNIKNLRNNLRNYLVSDSKNYHIRITNHFGKKVIWHLCQNASICYYHIRHKLPISWQFKQQLCNILCNLVSLDIFFLLTFTSYHPVKYSLNSDKLDWVLLQFAFPEDTKLFILSYA